MARIRTIKPEFFLHEGLAELPALTRLLFIGLWTIADRRGRLEDRPKRIKASIFPYDDVAIADHLAALEDAGFILRYELNDMKYLAIHGFEKHQHCHVKEPESIVPAPPAVPVNKGQHQSSTSPDQGLHQSGRAGRERKGTGREQEGNGSCAEALPPCPAPADPVPDSGRSSTRTAEIWRTYSTAYLRRYGVPPVRNAKINAQLANVVDRLGWTDAAPVAEFFVSHNARWYVEKGHAVGCLLTDAEKLRTEWATGRRTTSTLAQQHDQTLANGEVWSRLIAEAEAGAIVGVAEADATLREASR